MASLVVEAWLPRTSYPCRWRAPVTTDSIREAWERDSLLSVSSIKEPGGYAKPRTSSVPSAVYARADFNIAPSGCVPGRCDARAASPARVKPALGLPRLPLAPDHPRTTAIGATKFVAGISPAMQRVTRTQGHPNAVIGCHAN